MGFFSDTYIHTLRVQRSKPAQSLTRPVVDLLFNGMDLRPTGMPPAAVLIVHHLPDPLPGEIRPGSGAIAANQQWERQVNQALRGLYQQAARPSRGILPTGAQAVVFQDRAELLACLALDLVGDAASGRWWWRPFLGASNGRRLDALIHLLQQEPYSIPAIFQHLADWGKAGPVLESLSPTRAEVLLGVLHQISGAGEIGTADVSASSGTARVQGLSPELGRTDLTDAAALPSALTPTPPWPAPVARMIPARLSPTSACLLGAALSLSQRPEITRRPEFWQALTRWQTYLHSSGRLDAAHLAEDLPAPPPSEKAVPGVSPARLKMTRDSTGAQRFKSQEPKPVETLAERIPVSEDSPVAPAPQPEPNSPTTDDLLFEVFSRLKDPDHVEQPTTATASANPSFPESDPSPEEPLLDSPAKPANPPEPIRNAASKLPQGIPTRLAGVFYLVNLMTSLDMPGRLETACGLGQPLSAWALLGALSRCFLGGIDADWQRDPVWELLWALSDDQTVPTGEPLDRYCLPAGWLQMPPKQLYWTVDYQRLFVWARAGHLLVDIPWVTSRPTKEPEILAAVRSALHPLFERSRPVLSRGRNHGTITAWNSDVNQTVSALAERLTPFLRDWLSRKLGTGPGLVAETIFPHPGQLYLTPTHLDVVMDLEDISVPVRRAGLDIDPGWVPAFGRIIQFHYQ